MTNLRARLDDARRMWDIDACSLNDIAEYYKIEDRRRTIRTQLRSLRQEAGVERRAGRGKQRALGMAGRQAQHLEIEAKGLLDRQRHLKVVRCPRFWGASVRIRRDPGHRT